MTLRRLLGKVDGAEKVIALRTSLDLLLSTMPTPFETMRIRFPVVILAMALAGTIPLARVDANDAAGQTSARGTADRQATTMKIRMDVEGTRITATVVDNETARDFVSLLPLTLTFKDYAATEKISDLPRRLSTEGTPPGTDPSIGDITYYAPWGNLAVFYRDFGYSSGLVKLGQIDSNVEALNRPGPLTVTIELIDSSR